MSLIERLRSVCDCGLCTTCCAADRIAELEAANAQLNHDIGEYVDRTAELEAENERLTAALAKSCEEGRDELIQCPVATDRDCLKQENERLRAYILKTCFRCGGSGCAECLAAAEGKDDE